MPLDLTKPVQTRDGREVITAYGISLSAIEWALVTGICYGTLWSRIENLKWVPEKAVSMGSSRRYLLPGDTVGGDHQTWLAALGEMDGLMELCIEIEIMKHNASVPTFGTKESPAEWPTDFDGPELYWNGDHFLLNPETGSYLKRVAA